MLRLAGSVITAATMPASTTADAIVQQEITTPQPTEAIR